MVLTSDELDIEKLIKELNLDPDIENAIQASFDEVSSVTKSGTARALATMKCIAF